jgi:hypothetical protein
MKSNQVIAEAMYEATKRQPLMAKVSLNHEVARLRVTTAGEYVTVEVGPGYSARLSKKSAGEAREVTVSNASDCCAFVTSDLVVRGSSVERKLITTYVTKTIREDTLKLEGDEVYRTTRWRYPGGREAVATYSEKGRELHLFESGRHVKGLLTVGEKTPTGWKSSNQLMDAVDTGESTAFTRSMPGVGEVQVGIQYTGGGHYNYGVRMRGADGSILEGARGQSPDRLNFDEDKEVTDITSVSAVTGEFATSRQIVLSNSDGTSVSTRNSRVNIDGSSEGSRGLVQTWGDGFASQTEAYENNQMTQRSAYANDGHGNESETTVTYEKDGSFTIETNSTGEDGNTSHSAQTYDPEGNPKPSDGGDHPSDGGDTGDGGDHPSDGGDTGDGGDHPSDGGDTGLPADDGSGSNPSPTTINAGAGEGELPAYDGADSSPRPNASGAGGNALNEWLSAGSPFFGGPIGLAGNTDVSALNQILSAMDDGGDGDGTGGRSDDGTTPIFDLRALLREELDPENNPRALFAALATLTGRPLDSDGMRAASRLMQHLGD